ncbi:DUF805 domain-containing protein [Niveibacterium sp. SC-1]|uniref:DUF805 domain-containing protein n=1 Tax=Niveibacterium sp. SC-1 TaxID=3135646 RepID=UPI00311F1B1B
MSTAPMSPYAAPQAQVEDQYENTEARAPVKWLTASGRIGRWYYVAYGMGVPALIILAAGIVAAVTAAMGSVGSVLGIVLAVVAYVFMVVTQIFAGIRRCHDIDRSGWFLLLNLIPVVNLIVTLMLIFSQGTPGENRFGLRPQSAPRSIRWFAAVPFGAVFLVGILAAIAIPQYQQYVLRAKAAQVEQPAE